MSEIILYEYQKTRICKMYRCSDSNDKQYPDCEGIGPMPCNLNHILSVIKLLNEPKRKEEE